MVQIFENNNDNDKKKDKKDEDGRTGPVSKSMKVSNIAQQLEAVLKRPKTMGGPPEKDKDETPIIHTKVDLTEENKEIPNQGGGSRRKKAKKKAFIDDEDDNNN